MSTWSRCTARTALAIVASAMIVSGCASGNDDDITMTTEPSATTSVGSTRISISTSEAPPVTTEPDPTPAPTNVDPAPETTDPQRGCRRITDFADDAVNARWFIVDDGVMGGGSNGSVDIDDSFMSFSGTVVTDGGGFTSVRYRLDGTEMAATTRMTLRLRADDRVYGVTFEDDAESGQRSVSHRADLDTSGSVDAGGWTITTLEYSELRPSVFGRLVDAPAFRPEAAREIGIIIADGIDGDFSLDIDWIDVCE